MSERLLAVENLCVDFPTALRRGRRGSVRVLDEVSLEITRGETLALVGESGSGKSMTALSVLRLVPEPGEISSGRILLEGSNLLELPEREIRAVRGNRVAMIFQEPMSSLNPVLTIGRQVAEPIRLHRKANKSEARERAAELLDAVSIPDAKRRLDDYPHQFSGGMRQRVMIAMALACEPDLIIADEPTTALDVTVQAQILELLKDLTSRLNSALLLITHDLGVVARYADRVSVMYAGRIVESAGARDLYGTPSHPYTRGLLQSVPRLDDSAQTRLVPIDGQPPDLASLPPGCAFSPRCPDAHEKCRLERPELDLVVAESGSSRDHERACWGPETSRQPETP